MCIPWEKVVKPQYGLVFCINEMESFSVTVLNNQGIPVIVVLLCIVLVLVLLKAF